MCREPIEEIATLRASQNVWKDVTLKPGENPLQKVTGDALEIRAEMDISRSKSVESHAAHGQPIRYSVSEGVLSVGNASAPLKLADGKLHLQILLDRSSIEVFADHGQTSISRVVFPDGHDKSLSLTCDGGNVHVKDLDVSPLESIWKRAPSR